MRPLIKPETIDAILPQTQCGLCGYGACMPYAKALAKDNAAINLCPPGGVKVLRALADLLHEDAEPFVAEIEKKAKPKLLAVIREDECIGCTKCIQACPVDAILGSAKFMHSVIAQECTGCELCVAPCPVDCIDLVVIPEESAVLAEHARERFNARQSRLAAEQTKETAKQRKINKPDQTDDDKKTFIQEALLRVKLKRKN